VYVFFFLFVCIIFYYSFMEQKSGVVYVRIVCTPALLIPLLSLSADACWQLNWGGKRIVCVYVCLCGHSHVHTCIVLSILLRNIACTRWVAWIGEMYIYSYMSRLFRRMLWIAHSLKMIQVSGPESRHNMYKWFKNWKFRGNMLLIFCFLTISIRKTFWKLDSQLIVF